MADLRIPVKGVKLYKGVVDGMNCVIPCFVLNTVFTTGNRYNVATNQIHIQGSTIHVAETTLEAYDTFQVGNAYHYFNAASVEEINRLGIRRYVTRGYGMVLNNSLVSSASHNNDKQILLYILHEDNEGNLSIQQSLFNYASVIDSIAITFPSTGKLGYYVFDGETQSLPWTEFVADKSDILKATFTVWRESTDPYVPDPDTPGPDGPSEPGGGEGDRDDVDVPVPIPGLPPISAADTGFVTLFNPNATQIRNLANYMWSNNFDISLFKNIVANPIECILGLSIIPFTPQHGDPDTVKVGNIDTLMQFPTVANQFEEIDCGSIQVSEYWGSYLDYSPYTKISLYLPYIGIVPLDIDEVQGKTLAIKYHVDVLSGACIAYLLCGTSVLYSYIGQCSCNVPITSNDFTNTVNGVLGIAGNIGSLVALGGSSAPMAAGTAIKTAASMASNAINMLKPNIQKSGAMAGTGGLMGTQYPYIIKQRPRQSVPEGQNTFKGYPSNIAVRLGDLSGYTEVDEVHLDGIPATDAEMNEILQLLSEGVYI